MNRFLSRPPWALLLLLVLLTLAGIGCGTTESENMSSRPWNAPQGWETGQLPSSMNQGR